MALTKYFCGMIQKQIIMKKTLSTIIVVIFLFGTQLFAANDSGKAPKTPAGMAIISGTVTDASTGEGLAGALVEIEGTDLRVFTDLEGKYNIKDVEAGTYSLKVKYISYEEKNLPSLQVNSKDNSVDIQLETEK